MFAIVLRENKSTLEAIASSGLLRL